jgi:hypothetical protein
MRASVVVRPGKRGSRLRRDGRVDERKPGAEVLAGGRHDDLMGRIENSLNVRCAARLAEPSRPALSR